MFAFTKKAKLEKLLQKLYKEYNKLKEDKLSYERNTKDPEELQEAKLSKFYLELTRIAILFDELKEQYESFTVITSINDHWKLDKPDQSEGSLFYMHNDRPYIPSTIEIYTKQASPFFSTQEAKVKEIAQRNLKPYLIKALLNREKEKALVHYSGLFNAHGLHDVKLPYVLMYGPLLDFLVHPTTTNIISMPDTFVAEAELVNRIAKATKTNIIIHQRI